MLPRSFCLMSKRKLQLVPEKANPLVSDLSPEEEARALALADVALHNSPPRGPLRAGERAKAEHRNLVQQLEKAAKKVRQLKRAA